MRIRRITWVLVALVVVATAVVTLALFGQGSDVVVADVAVAGEGYVVMESGVPGQKEYITIP